MEYEQLRLCVCVDIETHFGLSFGLITKYPNKVLFQTYGLVCMRDGWPLNDRPALFLAAHIWQK